MQLRNIGVDAPALRAWQTRELHAHSAAPRRAIFAAPRLGKTRGALESFEAYGGFGRLRRLLIVTPLAVGPVWSEYLPTAVRGYSMSGSKLATAIATQPGAIIVNYDKVKTLLRPLQAWLGNGALILDESHYIKAPASHRAKACRKLAGTAHWVRLLTGTPAPNHYGDLWGQMVCLSPSAWGAKYRDFADQYLILDTLFPSRVLGHRNVASLQEKLLTWATVVNREDEFGPDTWQIVNRSLELPPVARRLYDRLATDWVTDSQRDGVAMQADHILARLIRLHQLAAGFAVQVTGEAVAMHTSKVDALLGDLEEILEQGEKAVIYYHYNLEGDALQKALGDNRAFVGRIHGGTAPLAREAYVERFQTMPGAGVLVAQAQAAGIGISLAASDHVMFMSQSFSFAEEIQARDRVYAPGKPRVVTYYRMRNTVDDFIANVIYAKEGVHNAVRNAPVSQMAWGRIR